MYTRSLLGLFLTALPALAQEPLALLGASPSGEPQPDIFVAPSQRPWLGEPPIGPVTKSITGRLTGHGIPDAIFLCDSRPMLMSAPGIHRSFGPLQSDQHHDITGVSDVAVLRGRGRLDGSHPALDALCLVGGAGLYVWRRPQGNASVSMTHVGGAEWNTTLFLATHPDDTSVIYGLDSAGTLHIARRDPVTHLFSTDPVTVITNQVPLALASIKWDLNGEADAAVLTANGLYVYGRTGSLLFSEAVTGAAGSSLARASSPYGDQLVWLAQEQGGTRLRSGSNGALSQPATLPAGFVGATACDWSGDGWDDLVLSTSTNMDVTVLVNLGTSLGFVFSPGTGFRVAVAAPSATRPGNLSAVATADFDGDGDGDLIAAIAGDGASAAHFTIVYSKLYDLPPSSAVDPILVEYNLVGEMATYTLQFGEAAGCTHTELIVWKAAAGCTAIEAEPELHQLHDRVGSGPLTITVELPVAPMIPGPGTPGGLFVYALRPVQVVGGVVTLAGEASFGAFFVDPTNSRIGGVVVRPDIPPAPPDEPPEPATSGTIN